MQFVVMVLGLALATGLWSAIQAINAEAKSSYAKAAAQVGWLSTYDRLTARSGQSVSVADFQTLRRGGWNVVAALEGQIDIYGQKLRLMGVDLVGLPPSSNQIVGQDDASIYEILLSPGRVYANAKMIKSLTPDPDLPPVALLDDLPDGVVLADINLAQTLLNLSNDLSYLLFLPDQLAALTPVSELTPNLKLVEGVEGTADLERLTDSFHLNLTAFGLLAFFVGILIVHSVIALAFEQRRGTVRVLRSLGVSLNTVSVMLLIELILLALVGGTVGILLGFAVSSALMPEVALSLKGLYGANIQGGIAVRPTWVLTAFAMALGGSILAAAQMFWRIRALPLLASVWGHGAVGPTYAAVLRPLVGILLIGIGGSVAFWSPLEHLDVVSGFAMIGAVMLGAVLALPWWLRQVLALLERTARAPLREWALADTRGQIPQMSLALAAFMLAVAANVGVTTMVGSFRSTFIGWLDQRLAAEIYVAIEKDEQLSALRAWADETPNVSAVLPIYGRDLPNFLGAPASVMGVVDHTTYRDNWPLIAASPNAWDLFASGQGVLINEQIAWREKLWPGDEVRFAGQDASKIVGVFSDYGNPLGQILIPAAQFVALYPDDARPRNIALRVQGDVDFIAQDLAAVTGIDPTRINQQSAIKAASLRIFERTFVVTSALNVLTLGVAGFAMLFSLLTLQNSRLPLLAPVWAMGVTRGYLARVELLRNLGMALVTLSVAIPLGCILAWMLLAVVNVVAFGWRLPFVAFPLEWGKLGGLACVVVIAASVLPVLRLRRISSSELIKVFVNER